MLRQFTGTEQWYRHPLNRRMLYTDGVKCFAEEAGNGAFWLLDVMVTEVRALHDRGEDFLHVVLDVVGSSATLRVDDGNDNSLWSRQIEYTDCPQGVWNFYQVWDGEYSVAMLPSEY